MTKTVWYHGSMARPAGDVHPALNVSVGTDGTRVTSRGPASAVVVVPVACDGSRIVGLRLVARLQGNAKITDVVIRDGTHQVGRWDVNLTGNVDHHIALDLTPIYAVGVGVSLLLRGSHEGVAVCDIVALGIVVE